MLLVWRHTQRAASGRSSSSSYPCFPPLWTSLISPALSPGCFLSRKNAAFYVKHSELLVLFLKWVKHLPPLQLPVSASTTQTCRVCLFFLPMSLKPDFKWLKSGKKSRAEMWPVGNSMYHSQHNKKGSKVLHRCIKIRTQMKSRCQFEEFGAGRRGTSEPVCLSLGGSLLLSPHRFRQPITSIYTTFQLKESPFSLLVVSLAQPFAPGGHHHHRFFLCLPAEM